MKQGRKTAGSRTIELPSGRTLTPTPSRRVKRLRDHLRHVRKTYGLSKKGYIDFFEKQKGRCAFCAQEEWEGKRMLAVDHDRNTGRVRGFCVWPAMQALDSSSMIRPCSEKP
jgi:hypothetical protein